MAEARYRLPVSHSGEEDLNGRMGFLEHLDELRTRLIRSCLAIAAGMGIAFGFVNRIADFVLAPTLRMLPPGGSLIMTGPGRACRSIWMSPSLPVWYWQHPM